MTKLPPRLNIGALQAEYGGCWVALSGQDVVDARLNPYELVQALREKGITATIVRVPDRTELETVGVG